MGRDREDGGMARSALLLALFGLPALGASETEASPRPGGVRERLAAFERNAPLHHALHRRDYDRALPLMAAEADIDRLDPVYGMTPLGLASQDETADAIDMVQPLLRSYGADPKVVDRQDYTALHYAATAGNHAVVEALLRFGADVDAAPPTAEGEPVTPLLLAWRRGRHRIAALLRVHGATEPALEVRRELELSAALFRAAEGPARVVGGATGQAAMRAQLEAMSQATERVLREQGRLEQLEGWLQVKERVQQALLATPAQTGETATEYVLRVSRNLQGAR